MSKKPRIPDPETVGHCDKCGRSIGGKGYYRPECQCGAPKPSREGWLNGPWDHTGLRVSRDRLVLRFFGVEHVA